MRLVPEKTRSLFSHPTTVCSWENRGWEEKHSATKKRPMSPWSSSIPPPRPKHAATAPINLCKASTLQRRCWITRASSVPIRFKAKAFVALCRATTNRFGNMCSPKIFGRRTLATRQSKTTPAASDQAVASAFRDFAIRWPRVDRVRIDNR